MIRVKVSTSFPNWPLLRQTTDSKGIWGNYQFFVNEEIVECDYWVVYEGLASSTESALCSPENVILITGEPPSVKKYKRRFLGQFNKILTCHENLQHENVILQQQAQPWHIGIKPKALEYQDFLSMTNPKHKLLSVISSNKTMTEGHRKRLEFVQALTKYFGSEVDVFGRGINDIDDKGEAIFSYKYHIVIENDSLSNYWTEKLSDCYLGGAFPIYHGCKNIGEYFPEESYEPIDIYNISEALDKIKKVLQNDEYDKNAEYLNQSKRMVLDKYNLFPMITSYFNENARNKKNITLKDESVFSFRRWLKR